MSIDWVTILGAIGTFLGGGWIISFYHAKPKKNSIEIANMKSVIDELQDVLSDMSKHSADYRKQTEERIKTLSDKIDELYEKMHNREHSIYAAYKCKAVESTEDCPVLRHFLDKCKECNNYGGKE